jgi:predicted DCC family thiol-disulfide oxidoreductase YuxK
MKMIYFDGHCSLCNDLVDWLMRVDTEARFCFASLQGESASKNLAPEHRSNLNTLVYQRDTLISVRSTAILLILSDLGGWWRLTKPLLWIPRPLRDLLYGVFATYRYRIFGRRETCRVPTAGEKDRLLP